MSNDTGWMKEALALAREAERRGEVPVGALIVRDEQVVGRGFNRREIDADPTAHAEMIALREAARAIGGWRLSGCRIYVTLEPCAMCAGALVNSRIDRLVFGARDPKGGYCRSLGNLVEDSRLNHRIEVSEGVLNEECSRILTRFFATLRGQ